MKEMEEKFQVEQEGEHPWYEVLTGHRMLHRVVLGVVILTLQQLTGANYFFYYETTVFALVGISNSYVTHIILEAINVVCTFPSLWFVEKYGRRKCLTIGAAWMFMCFVVFTSVGKFGARGTPAQTEGYVLIIFR